MQIVANYWWLWLIGAVVTLLYGGYNQVQRMRGMLKEDIAFLACPFRLEGGGRDNFLSGLFPLFVAAVANMGFIVLLVTSIVLHVIDYSKH